MNGFFNRVLYINLDDLSFHYQEISENMLKNWLGGKGLAVQYLMAENPVGVEPTAPENIFIIATGPASTTPMWGRARFAVYSKSPATGGFGESYCGGSLAAKIKGCGVDLVIIKGKSSQLKYLVITEEGVTFDDASPLKGWETHDAERYIIEHAPKGSSAMVIGPAGENLVRFACLKADRWRSLGRGGMGAVLGAKNIKGIAFAGKKMSAVADWNLLKKLMAIVTQKGKEAPVTELYYRLGTPMQVKVTNNQKCFPTRYWQSGCFKDHDKISADYMQENFDLKSVGCPNCFLKCTKFSKIRHGRHQGLELEGPEYETIYAIGGLNEVNSLEEIAWLNDICDRLGLDTMSAGNMTAFATEARLAGKIDFPIHYNDPDRMAELLHLMAYRQGIGDILASGIKKASTQLGLENLAVHVKGLEPAGFDPRVLKGMGLAYATAARGACHLRGTFYKAELSGQMDKDQLEGKAELFIDYEDRATLFDSMILCRFFRDFILWDELAMLIKATTGLEYSRLELGEIANAISNLTREYNRREGLTESFDTLPERFFSESTEEGASLKREELDRLIRDYNQLRRR